MSLFIPKSKVKSEIQMQGLRKKLQTQEPKIDRLKLRSNGLWLPDKVWDKIEEGAK